MRVRGWYHTGNIVGIFVGCLLQLQCRNFCSVSFGTHSLNSVTHTVIIHSMSEENIDWENEPRAKNGSGRARRWAFTFNNYTEDDCKHICSLASHVDIRYLIVGREVGKSGTPHLQGYVELRQPTRITGLKRLLGSNTIHVEAAFASGQRNKLYCTKPGSELLVEAGNLEGDQGQRSDLDRVAQSVLQGASARDILELAPSTFIRYHRGIERSIELMRTQRSFATQLVWCYGASGSGKSQLVARESANFYGESVSWVDVEKGHFFNNLASGCKGVVFDEYDGSIPIAKFLRLFDRYPICVPVKGGSVVWSPRVVWITSQYEPGHYYSEGLQWVALVRRLVEFGQVLKFELVENELTGRVERRITHVEYD